MIDSIVRGIDHLGNCPKCGYAIVEISWTPTQHLVHARCVVGHENINPTMIVRHDAPSPVYPMQGYGPDCGFG